MHAAKSVQTPNVLLPIPVTTIFVQRDDLSDQTKSVGSRSLTLFRLSAVDPLGQGWRNESLDGVVDRDHSDKGQPIREITSVAGLRKDCKNTGN